MKWVYEANNTISALNGSAAMADGSNVIWMWDAALGTSDYTFFTFNHETAHNQDGRYFYGGAGRREGTGGESFRLLPAGGRSGFQRDTALGGKLYSGKVYGDPGGERPQPDGNEGASVR